MDKRTRAWSIVALSLLCALLAYVLLRTPPKVGPPSQAPPRAHQAASPPATHPPSTEPEFNRDMYRGWPLFLGWPLPEVPPPDWGTGGSQPPPTPPHRPPDQQ